MGLNCQFIQRHFGPVFPRLAAMAISTDHYTPEYLDAIAKMDLAIVNFYPGAPQGPKAVIAELKAINPRLQVGIYTDLNDQIDSPAWQEVLTKLTGENWWLTDKGQRISAWGGKSFYCNLSTPWPQWMTEYCHQTFFAGSQADWWYCDCVQKTQRVKEGDFNGRDETVTPEINSAYRAAYASVWPKMRSLTGCKVMGNADNDLSTPEYRGKLDGAFLEGLMGYPWSLQSWAGWDAMMARYRAALANTRKPHTVIFNAAGEPTNLKLFRFAYTSCLLDDGYFSFSGANGNYGVVPWFEEYGIELGRAREKHLTPYENGVYRRRFQNGTVYCNPTKLTQTVDGHVIAPEDGVVCRGVH